MKIRENDNVRFGLLIKTKKSVRTMVLMINGNSEYVAHLRLNRLNYSFFKFESDLITDMTTHVRIYFHFPLITVP